MNLLRRFPASFPPSAEWNGRRLQKFVHRGDSLIDFDWRQGELAAGLRSYEAGDFFAAHEAWEDVWLRSREPDRTFLQALIQVTAAFYHLQRRNPRGAATLLQAALQRLAHYSDWYGGLSVASVRDDIRERLRLLEAGQPAPPVQIRARTSVPRPALPGS